MSYDQQLIDHNIAEWSKQGWRVAAQSATGVQFTKPRAWNVGGVVVFILLPALLALFWWYAIGFAVIGALIVVADYLLRKDELVYLTLDQMRQHAAKVKA